MLRRPDRFFQLAHSTPRMLPRAFNPERLDVELQPDSPEPVRDMRGLTYCGIYKSTFKHWGSCWLYAVPA